jgi:hypothetical protein
VNQFLSLPVNDTGKLIKFPFHCFLVCALLRSIKIDDTSVADIIHKKVWRSDIAMEETGLMDSLQCSPESLPVVKRESYGSKLLFAHTASEYQFLLSSMHEPICPHGSELVRGYHLQDL